MASGIADLLAPFAEAASIRLRDTSGTLRKRIIVSLHSADVERVYDSVFSNNKDEAFDWEAVRAYLTHSGPLTTTGDWVRLVTLLHFIADPGFVRPEVGKLLASAQAGVRASVHCGVTLTPVEGMQLALARAGFGRQPPWDTVCKALVLVNLADVDPAEALQQLLKQPATPVVNQLSTLRHTREEYTRTFGELLHAEACSVASHHILRSIWAREEQQERARQRTMALFTGTEKPSLTRILREQGDKKESPTTANAFVRFCRTMRLPDNLAHPLKVMCYGLYTLQGSPIAVRQAAVARLLSERGAAQPILRHLLAGPEEEEEEEHDAPTIRAFIMGAQHTGTPFPELQQFRQACGARGTWTTVLRLYLAAYCPLRKDMWEHVNASAASDAARYAVAVGREGDQRSAVQAFVQQTPPALDALVTTLLRCDAA